MSIRNRWLIVMIAWAVLTFIGLWVIIPRDAAMVWLAVMFFFGAWPAVKLVHAPT